LEFFFLYAAQSAAMDIICCRDAAASIGWIVAARREVTEGCFASARLMSGAWLSSSFARISVDLRASPSTSPGKPRRGALQLNNFHHLGKIYSIFCKSRSR
jgi:hypothetical protein